MGIPTNPVDQDVNDILPKSRLKQVIETKTASGQGYPH